MPISGSSGRWLGVRDMVRNLGESDGEMEGAHGIAERRSLIERSGMTTCFCSTVVTPPPLAAVAGFIGTLSGEDGGRREGGTGGRVGRRRLLYGDGAARRQLPLRPWHAWPDFSRRKTGILPFP